MFAVLFLRRDLGCEDDNPRYYQPDPVLSSAEFMHDFEFNRSELIGTSTIIRPSDQFSSGTEEIGTDRRKEGTE